MMITDCFQCWHRVLASPGYWPWIALFLLGAYHGINPGMGWLFAVALGLQEKSRRAVLRALTPMLVGHMASIAIVVLGVQLLKAEVPHAVLRLAAAIVLIVFGASRLVRSRHPQWARWGGMQVGFRDLMFWSFLMASAHGAGLMLIPIMLGWPAATHVHSPAVLARFSPETPALGHHVGAAAVPATNGLVSPSTWLGPVGVHTLGYVLVTGLIALLVYERFGVAILRRAWFNLDFVWAVALVATGLLILFV